MTRRRGRGEGSIRKRSDGRWEGQISLGIADGKRKRKSVYGATKTEVQRKIRMLQSSIDRGMPVTTNTPRLKDFLAQWLTSKKQRISPSTYRSYETIVRRHIVPDLGHIRLDKLTQHNVNDLLTRKIERANLAAEQKAHPELVPKGEKPIRFSLATVDGIRRVLRAALSDAMRADYVGRNVASLSGVITVPRFEGKALSRGEAERFLQAVEGERYALLYRIAVTAGLRQGEILGLRWIDVDFDDGVIRIRRQLQRVEGVQVLRDLKTVESRRTIPMPQNILDALKRHQVSQKEERLQAGGRWQGERWQLVFMTPNGTPIDDANLRKDFRKRLEQAGLEPMRFHDLRHSAASFMAAQGVHVKEAQHILGHSQVTTTMQVYTHAQLDNMRDALERVSGGFDTKKEAENA